MPGEENIKNAKTGYDVTPKLAPVEKFWKAKDYHPDYYQKTAK